MMDPEGRICELDTNSHYRELVYATMDAKRHWDEMSWTQASLYEAAQKGMLIALVFSNASQVALNRGVVFMDTLHIVSGPQLKSFV